MKVNASMLLEYLKKCSLPLVITFISLTILLHLLGILSSYWLSDWADTNIGAKNNSLTANMSLVTRMTTFAAIGSLQSKKLYFKNTEL